MRQRRRAADLANRAKQFSTALFFSDHQATRDSDLPAHGEMCPIRNRRFRPSQPTFSGMCPRLHRRLRCQSPLFHSRLIATANAHPLPTLSPPYCLPRCACIRALPARPFLFSSTYSVRVNCDATPASRPRIRSFCHTRLSLSTTSARARTTPLVSHTLTVCATDRHCCIETRRAN